MKKILCFALLGIVFSIKAQNLPKSATEIMPLLIGETIPNVTLQSVTGSNVNLAELFQKQKTILVVYRGGWCPYCNLHLAALGEAEKELIQLGYQIVAVSPDGIKNLKITDANEKLNYLLLSDSKGVLSKAIGIAFQAPENYKPYISEASDNANTDFLPVPSVFIINENGVILFEHITPNFKERITNNLLIAVSQSLK